VNPIPENVIGHGLDFIIRKDRDGMEEIIFRARISAKMLLEVRLCGLYCRRIQLLFSLFVALADERTLPPILQAFKILPA